MIGNGKNNTYFQLLSKFPSFRNLYFARTISLFGDWFNLIALLALLREQGVSQAEVVGGLFIVKLLPNFFASLPAGITADRFSRRRIMIISNLISTALTLAFFGAPLFKESVVVIVFSLTALQIVTSTFFEPARTASIPNLVPEQYLSAANALGAASWSLMYALGIGLGGVVTELLGWEIALLIDASTFLISALFILRCEIPQTIVRNSNSGGFYELSGLNDITLALRFLKANRDTIPLILLKSAWCISGAVVLLLTLYGQQRYQFGFGPDMGVALLMVARAIGTGLGPIITRIYSQESERRMRMAINIGFYIGALGYIIFSQTSSALVALIAVFIAHVGGSSVWVFSTVLLQRHLPDEIRGKVFAAELGMATLMISLSIYIYSQLTHYHFFTLDGLALLLGASLILPGIWWSLSGVRTQAAERSTPAGDVQ